MSKPYTDEDTLRKLYWGEKLTTYDIGEKFDVSGATIQNWMDKLGVEKRDKTHILNHGSTPEELKDREKLKEMYIDERKPAREIARDVGCAKATVLNWLDRHDIEKRQKGEAQAKHAELLDESWLRNQHNQKGKSQHQIAKELGSHPVVVNQWMKKHGIEGRTELGPNSGQEEFDEKGPQWDKKRKLALKRDSYRCSDCDAEQGPNGVSLDVHHITPRHKFVGEDGSIDWDSANDVDNLISLCRSCHLKRHSG